MSDLIQRAAAICGFPFTPNSDQLAAWLDAKGCETDILHKHGFGRWPAGVFMTGGFPHYFEASLHDPHPTLLEALAAAVVEVDRIEREAAK